jgi:elongation factor Ts
LATGNLELVRESAILEEKNAGKPAQVLEKIDGAKTMTQVLPAVSKSAGAEVKLLGFARMQLGEGIVNFAGDSKRRYAGLGETILKLPVEGRDGCRDESGGCD